MEPNDKTSINKDECTQECASESPPTLKAQADAMGLNWDDVKKGLQRIIPMLELVARMTSNTYDDLAVEFLKKLVSPN